MLQVKSVKVQAAPSVQKAAGKPLMPASGFFAVAMGFAIAAFLVVPGIWSWQGGQPTSGAALGVRLFVFVGSFAGLAATLMAIGVAVTGQRMGVLWTARNTYSLSRVQVTLWTLLVLSALAAVVVCRAHGLLVAAGSAGVGSALNIDIPPELLTVMGISVASGAAAPAILSLKTQADPPPVHELEAAESRVGGALAAVGNVAVRPSDCPPLVKDLFQGDEVSKAGTVDMGKVQQAIVTVILWCIYLAMLTQLFAAGESGPSKIAGGTALPAMPDAFVYLLAISHAGYLAYKAAPAPGGASGTAAPPQSLSAVLPRPMPPRL
jgi:hypothetical protein